MKYLLDTNVVSNPALARPNPTVVERLEALSGSCAIGAPVWHELRYGCARLPRGKRRARLEAYLHDVVRRVYRILPYDEVAADWHGAERARLEALGRPAAFVDGQIAAIAVTTGLHLVTENTRDFVRFRGLIVEDWSR